MMDYRSRLYKFSKRIRIHLKILGIEMNIWSKCHTAGQQILGATIQDKVAMATWHVGFVCLCLRSYSILSRLRGSCDIPVHQADFPFLFSDSEVLYVVIFLLWGSCENSSCLLIRALINESNSLPLLLLYCMIIHMVQENVIRVGFSVLTLK